MYLKSNLQAQLDELIRGLEGRPTLLLHSCCAPCSSYVLEYLAPSFDITLFYYNPNIWQEGEYQRRLEEQRRLLSRMPAAGAVTLLVGDYGPERFLDAVKGMETEPERGVRCEICFRLRLGEAARVAAERGCDYVTTTLSVSPHKDAQTIDRILRACCEGGVRALPSDFKKKGGYQRSLILSREYGLYRQDYCGCMFSRRNTEDGNTCR